MKIGESAPTWAAFILIAVIGLMFFLRSERRGSPAPESVVHGMFQAAAKGDVGAYLDSFTGELRARLEAARREAGNARFEKDLRDSAAGVTGIAISRPSATSSSERDGKAMLRVERVFRDRNEAQEFVLVPIKGGWRIESAGTAATVKMPIPYGTPVYATESTGTSGTK